MRKDLTLLCLLVLGDRALQHKTDCHALPLLELVEDVTLRAAELNEDVVRYRLPCVTVECRAVKDNLSLGEVCASLCGDSDSIINLCHLACNLIFCHVNYYLLVSCSSENLLVSDILLVGKQELTELVAMLNKQSLAAVVVKAVHLRVHHARDER